MTISKNPKFQRILNASFSAVKWVASCEYMGPAILRWNGCSKSKVNVGIMPALNITTHLYSGHPNTSPGEIFDRWVKCTTPSPYDMAIQTGPWGFF